MIEHSISRSRRFRDDPASPRSSRHHGEGEGASRAEKQAEEKQVNIDEHLLPPRPSPRRYKTQISLDKPGESFGLTSAQAEELLGQHGPNVLTPPRSDTRFSSSWTASGACSICS